MCNSVREDYLVVNPFTNKSHAAIFTYQFLANIIPVKISYNFDIYVKYHRCHRKDKHCRFVGPN